MKKYLWLIAGLFLLFSCSNNAIDTANADFAVTGETSRAYGGSTTVTDVLLQGFHWTSWQYGTWNIIRNNATAIKNGGFTMVWLPPPSRAADNTGYLPNEWRNYNSKHGTASQLQAALTALNNAGVKPIGDIVINHRVGTTNWADFTNPAFSDNRAAVTRNDEWGQGTGAWDTGTNYNAGRDLDHTNANVRSTISSWMNQMKSMGYKGWRYDYVHGFSGSYIGTYNDATKPYFSVGELWPDIVGDYYASGNNVNYHRQRLMDWINATGNKSAAFDFTTKWQLSLAVSRNEYWRMRDPNGKAIGAIGWWPQMSVTFLDNHDTGPSTGGGGQNHWPFPSNKVEEGYAYILTHPGTPTVYWPHYFDWGTGLQGKIRTLIAIRKEKGVRSTSSLSIQRSETGLYAAIINGNVAMKMGPNSWSPGSGWTLRTSGTNWAVWTK